MAKSTKTQDKNLAQKLADIVTNKTEAKTETKTADEKPKTLSQKLMDINDKAFEERKKMSMKTILKRQGVMVMVMMYVLLFLLH